MKPPARITFISHAPTAATRRAAFPRDEPIEEAARKRIQEGKLRLGQTERVYCGPEKRAKETSEALGLSAAVDPMLRDCDYGRWAGRDLDALQREHPEEVALWLSDPGATPHGGESIYGLIARLKAWLDERTKNGHIVAITHPAAIRGAIVSVLESPAQSFWRMDIVPLSVTDIRFDGRIWRVRSMGAQFKAVNI